MILTAVLAATHRIWLRAIGRVLVREDGPAAARVAVVLAGDSHGNRILKACDLIRAGYVPNALVSGPVVAYGLHESEFAIDYAVRQGCPRDSLIPLPHNATSTDEESRVVLDELRRRNDDSFLLVTSSYHTRRAGAIFQPRLNGIHMRVVAAGDRYFDPDRWWTSGHAAATFLLEWAKTVATAVGL